MARSRQTTTAGAWTLAVAVAAAPLPVVASEPVTSQPVTSQPVTSQAVTSQAVTSQPVTSQPVTSQPVTSEAESTTPGASDIPNTPRNATFVNQDGWTTPKPGPQTSTSGQEPRRWQVRQAPLAGAEASWGPPGGQMPEYAEIVEPEPAKGPPPKGTPRIVAGAILGPVGLGLAIGGIVGATTDVLGDSKRLSVPMIGVGLVASAIGWALFADGVLRRKKFMRWQAKGGEVALAPVLAPGRAAGAQVGLQLRLRF